MVLLDKDGNPIVPTKFEEFQKIYNGLLTGERAPEGQREKLLADSIKRVQDILEELEAPLDVLTLCFWSWIAASQWRPGAYLDVVIVPAGRSDYVRCVGGYRRDRGGEPWRRRS